MDKVPQNIWEEYALAHIGWEEAKAVAAAAQDRVKEARERFLRVRTVIQGELACKEYYDEQERNGYAPQLGKTDVTEELPPW